MLVASAGMAAYDEVDNPDSGNIIENESLYGEWRLVGWYDEGTWFKVDTNYVSHQHLSIEFKENGYVGAWSMVNEITVGQLTLNGNDMVWDTTHRGTTMVGCDIMENNFFEDHIFDIRYFQISGKQLKLYYTDEDYFTFTKDYDDSDEYAYAWKNGLPDPYIGEVTTVNDGEVAVKVLDYPRYAHYYTLSRPPSSSNHICHFAASDLSGLSFEFGDKVAFLIDQFRRQKGNEGEYQCVVKPYESSGRIDDVVGFVYNDKLFQGWCIMVPNDNYNSTATYYIPMKPLPESYLTDGQPVVFSGALYPTQCYVSNYAHRSDAQYFVDNDKLEKLSTEEVRTGWSVTPVEEGNVYAVLSDYFQNKYPSVPSSYQFFRKTDNNKTEMYNRSDNIHLGEKAEFPEIDLSNYTLVVGQQVMEDGYYTVVRQDMVPAVDGWQLNLYVKKEEGDHSLPQYLFYWGLYPQKEYYHISVNIVEETHASAQTYYFYDTYGKKMTITLNESKVVVSIPKECDKISERIRTNVQVLWDLYDTYFDIFFITRSDFEQLTKLDFWEEDAKSVIVTPSYFVEDDDYINRGLREAFSTPYVLVQLKKEEDIEILTSYIEKYRLTITWHSSLMPLLYTLALTLDSEKSLLEIANEMFESGNFRCSSPDLAWIGTDADEPSTIRSITKSKTDASSEFYDLQGRKLTSKPSSGIYIHRGQKKLAGSR